MKAKTKGPTGMSREEELRLQAEFIEKNGITMLPPDERLFEDPDWSAWAKKAKEKKKQAKLAKKKAAALKNINNAKD
tara:strand:- start:297 stop:527 length:231 start_codon:yes stop_codon:yes gene_type:complete